MNLSLNLPSVPLVDFLLIAVLILLLIVIVRVGRHHSQPPPVTRSLGRRVAGAFFYLLKLAGFAILAFILIAGVVMLYKDYQTVGAETAPAPSDVQVPADFPWPLEEVTFKGGDNLKLAGWFLPPRNGATIILLHGYGGNRAGMLWQAQVLGQAGYGLLLYDERASGESEGAYRSFGWEDRADVGGALVYLGGRPDVDPARIGIAGCSIGGQIALQGAASYPALRAVWADGPSTIRAGDNPPPQNWATVLVVTSNYILDGMYEYRLGLQAPPPMIEIIGQIAPRPVMLVGGGTAYPYLGSEARQVEHYARYAGPNAGVWIIPEAVHCDGPNRRPEEYARRMAAFFNAAFSLPESEPVAGGVPAK